MTQPTEASIGRIAMLNAEASATIAKGTIVKLDTSQRLAVLKGTAATELLFGVALEDITAGTWGTICFLGKCLVLADGVHSVGAYLTPDSAGEAVATTTNLERWIAIALETGVADTLVEALVVGPGMEKSVA